MWANGMDGWRNVLAILKAAAPAAEELEELYYVLGEEEVVYAVHVYARRGRLGDADFWERLASALMALATWLPQDKFLRRMAREAVDEALTRGRYPTIYERKGRQVAPTPPKGRDVWVVRWLGAYGGDDFSPIESLRWELDPAAEGKDGRVLAAETLWPREVSYVPGAVGLRVAQTCLEGALLRAWDRDAYTDDRGRASEPGSFVTKPRYLPGLHERHRRRHRHWHTEVSLDAGRVRYDALIVPDGAEEAIGEARLVKLIRWARRHGLKIIAVPAKPRM